MANINLKLGYYFSDSNNKLYGPFTSIKDCEKHDYERIWKLEKSRIKDSKVTRIIINFKLSQVTIVGEKNCSVSILGQEIGAGTFKFPSESWERVIAESKKACDKIVFKGVPTIGGEYLNEVLHLQ